MLLLLKGVIILNKIDTILCLIAQVIYYIFAILSLGNYNYSGHGSGIGFKFFNRYHFSW